MSDFRTYMQRSIIKAIRDGLTGTAVQVPGMRDEISESTEEWVAFFPLEWTSWPTRKTVAGGRVMFQVSCFSRFAEQRADGQTDAPQVLAGRVRALLDGAGILIRSYGASPVADVACLQLGHADEVYLDERSIGVIGPGGSSVPGAGATTGGTVSNMHAVALTYRGTSAVI